MNAALLSLAARSAWNRRGVLALVVASIALSTLLLVGIERIRHEVRESFSQSVSGTDLIVGARTGPVQLMLYAVFRIGSATNNISWDAAQMLAQHRAVAWTLPISLGDSHRGHAVVGTRAAYFERFRYGERQALALAEGRAFVDGIEGVFDVVIGSEVAHRLGYRLGQRVVLSHGDGAIAANDHADKPFKVAGILAPTGTPVDRSLHVSLEAIEALHLDWQAGVPIASMAVPADQLAQQDLTPRSVTAVLVGLKSRAAVFSVQRQVANHRAEPLMAVLPGVALDELWEVIGVGERGLLAVGVLVSVVSLAGLVAVILAGLAQRRRELAILRTVGCGPRTLLALLALEGALVTLAGVVLGLLAGALLLALGADLIQQHTGLRPGLGWPGADEWRWVGAVLAGGWTASLLPGWRAYRLSLTDGLSPRL
ncbi:ABC transporter permease [Leptothrix discophora]|uniref:ABC transporter permease n=1 Tax=Leptothrix discophora TaxID=89 RepID=A0ABT9G493_LEPDI|nr:ABC transporter permease [Leptothrix discophora]MDP4301300.1 ABC transporter permease [Leptothrix discophora]